MLTKQENEIMNSVYRLCEGKGSCLVSPLEIMRMLPEKRKYTVERVDRILRSLELDDYFDIIESDRKGERMYVITLHPNGFAFKRSSVQMRRDLFFKVSWTILSAILAFLVGLLMKRIF